MRKFEIGTLAREIHNNNFQLDWALLGRLFSDKLLLCCMSKMNGKYRLFIIQFFVVCILPRMSADEPNNQSVSNFTAFIFNPPYSSQILLTHFTLGNIFHKKKVYIHSVEQQLLCQALCLFIEYINSPLIRLVRQNF